MNCFGLPPTRRMRDQQGWQVYYVPQAQIIHHHLAVSDKRLWSRYTAYHLQSMLRYARKHLLPQWTGLAITAPRTILWEEARRS